MAVAVAVARGVHHPSQENGKQDEGDESADQRPEHGANHKGWLGILRGQTGAEGFEPAF